MVYKLAISYYLFVLPPNNANIAHPSYDHLSILQIIFARASYLSMCSVTPGRGTTIIYLCHLLVANRFPHLLSVAAGYRSWSIN